MNRIIHIIAIHSIGSSRNVSILLLSFFKECSALKHFPLFKKINSNVRYTVFFLAQREKTKINYICSVKLFKKNSFYVVKYKKKNAINVMGLVIVFRSFCDSFSFFVHIISFYNICLFFDYFYKFL